VLKLAQELLRLGKQGRKSVLKVQRKENSHGVFAVSGRLDAEGLRELSALLALEPWGRPVTLELQDLVLVDRDAVDFLRACEADGILLRNCPAYIRAWMASDRDQG
jgi:hypothetical protein